MLLIGNRLFLVFIVWVISLESQFEIPLLKVSKGFGIFDMCFNDTLVYLSVVLLDECPMRTWISLKDWPASCKWVA